MEGDLGDLPLLSQRCIHNHTPSSRPSPTWPVPILDRGSACRCPAVDGVGTHHCEGICSCIGLPGESPGQGLFDSESVRIEMHRGGLQGPGKLGGVCQILHQEPHLCPSHSHRWSLGWYPATSRMPSPMEGIVMRSLFRSLPPGGEVVCCQRLRHQSNRRGLHQNRPQKWRWGHKGFGEV